MMFHSVLYVLFTLFLCSLSFYSPVSCGDPKHPLWPVEFDAPFGLYDFSLYPAPEINVESHFYYHVKSDYQAQLIDYPSRCINLYPGSASSPCQLLFAQNNIYFSTPAFQAAQHQSNSLSCCMLFPSVGPTPPEFLRGFSLNSTGVLINNHLNQPTETFYWYGAGFSYWTDATNGHDVLFQDGPGGPFWMWGEFNVAPQNQSLFQLPNQSQCNQPCQFPTAKLDQTPFIRHLANRKPSKY